jgi:LysM repeat protein
MISAAALAASTPASASAAVPHTVVSGETMSGIAAANGVSNEAVAAFNGLPADHVVIIGETILVPTADEAAATGTTATSTATATTSAPTTASTGGHTVAAGESFSSIAAANGVTAEALASANGLSLDSVIVPGQTLTVPAATTNTAAVAPATPAGTPSGSLGYVPSPYGDLALDSGAASSWNAMREESLATYGQDIYPGGPMSAYRSYDQQAQLYDDYVNGTGPLAAAPGTSAHETGTAVDVPDPAMRSAIDSLGWAYGWGKTEAPDEWWHLNWGG